MSGTASGILDAHGYVYAGLQAVRFGWRLDRGGSPWVVVFLLMAATRSSVGVDLLWESLTLVGSN